MKRIKKLLILGFTIILSFVVISCNNNGKKEEQTKIFDQKVATDEYLAQETTCIAKARYYYSSIDGEKGADTFEYGELKNHTPIEVVGHAATCSNNGLTNGSICSVCQEVLVPQNKTDKLEHNYNDIIDPVPSFKTEGLKTRTCSECGSKLCETLPKLTYQRVDINNNPDEKGDYILYGFYPQTIKLKTVNITTTVDDLGYYLGDDGEQYAKVQATPDNTTNFSDGTQIVKDETYYFKVEPIRWKILDSTKISNGSKLLLVSEKILTCGRFAESVNNYKNSEIKEWLNGDFFTKSFTETQKLLNTGTLVNNDTLDKVFLLSYEEVKKSQYGFENMDDGTDTRLKERTDYATAKGLFCNNKFGYWWLRTPDDSSTINVRYINFYGGIVSAGITDHRIGIVPAITIYV